MKFLRYLLFPVVPIYYLVTWLRNFFYDKGVFASKTYEFPVICVGNLSVGGTGKTPMIEYLIALLSSKKKVATLSRGYKRSSKGFYLADAASNAKTLGDEPFQFYRKFKKDILVAVDADRQNGIAQLMQQKIAPEVILLDDAFQHRKVKAGFNILLTTFQDLYTRDWVLPTGNLREPSLGAKRAQVIVVTKCPENIAALEKEKIVKEMHLKPYQKVFFSHIHYANEVFSEANKIPLKTLQHFTLVTGIANAKPLVSYLKALGLQFDHLHYKDHHDFNASDIALFKQKSCIITTEKDYVRLFQNENLKGKVYYIPIQIVLDKPDDFNALITGFVST